MDRLAQRQSGDKSPHSKLVWLFVGLLLVVGCTPAGQLYKLVVPEQSNLKVREPEQIASSPALAYPPPVTVVNPAPPGTSQNMSLDEAIRIALANAKVIRVLAGTTVTSSLQTVYDPAISNTSIDAARAAFDPTLSVQNTWKRTNDPLGFLDPAVPFASIIRSTPIDEFGVNVGLSQRNVLGGTLGFNYVNADDRLHSGVFALNPQNTNSIVMSYTQPLFKGAGVAANVAPIVIARLNTERSYFQFRDSVQEMVRGVIDAYWGVVFARIDVWAKRQQVEFGEESYKFAEAKMRLGQGNAADAAQALVALSNFKANLIGAEAGLLQREAALRNILGLPPTEPQRVVPTTPPTRVRVEPKWDQVVKLATQRRPDLIELELIIEADQQALIQADNQALPQVDAAVSYKWNGLDGQTPAGPTIATTPGQYTDWSVGVNFSVPLGLRQSRAALRSAELLLAKDHANLDQGVHAAVNELADSFRGIAQDYQQYLAFKETRAAAWDNLKQQVAVYRAGIGKTGIYLNVLQAISDWGNAVSSEALALTQYNTDLANLERRTGTILETHAVWFLEERYRSIGPLGRLANGRCYPEAVVPGPNGNNYPAGTEPADSSFDLERPALPKGTPPRQGGSGVDQLPPPRAILKGPQ